MTKAYFVHEKSIVRQIWGRADTVLFIFAGAAAEFALNKAVDWLYFTGKIPSDPLGRLFSTVTYAKAIIFSEREQALRTIDAMSSIHANVESSRGHKIPDWAFRDVLYLLIDYSIRSYEILERQLRYEEKVEVFQVFNRVGQRMGVCGLPATYQAWQISRMDHLRQNLRHSHYTVDLFKQYRKHLGAVRYKVLIEVQSLIAPPQVRAMLGLRKTSLLYPLLSIYKLSKKLWLDLVLIVLLVPAKFKNQVRKLESMPGV